MRGISWLAENRVVSQQDSSRQHFYSSCSFLSPVIIHLTGHDHFFCSQLFPSKRSILYYLHFAFFFTIHLYYSCCMYSQTDRNPTSMQSEALTVATVKLIVFRVVTVCSSNVSELPVSPPPHHPSQQKRLAPKDGGSTKRAPSYLRNCSLLNHTKYKS
jgi:hypothetical protein